MPVPRSSNRVGVKAWGDGPWRRPDLLSSEDGRQIRGQAQAQAQAQFPSQPPTGEGSSRGRGRGRGRGHGIPSGRGGPGIPAAYAPRGGRNGCGRGCAGMGRETVAEKGPGRGQDGEKKNEGESGSAAPVNPATTSNTPCAAPVHGRLKPPPDSSYGLVSKGDIKLLDFTAQEDLFKDICAKYNQLYPLPPTDTNPNLNRTSESTTPTPPAPPAPPAPPSSSTTTPTSTSKRHHVPLSASSASLLMSLRQLREGIRASSRLDPFVKDVYTFNVRAAIYLRHPESYLPSLIHLIGPIHNQLPLISTELVEFAGYYVLHLACALGDFNEALRVGRMHHVPQNGFVMRIVKALVRSDYWGWFKVREEIKTGDLGNGADDTRVYLERLMEMGADRIRFRALECLKKAYFEVEREFVEKLMGMEWGDVKGKFGLEWELSESGRKLTLRRRKT